MANSEQKGPNRLLVAIGGNATHPENIEGTSKEQEEIAKVTASALKKSISFLYFNFIDPSN